MTPSGSTAMGAPCCPPRASPCRQGLVPRGRLCCVLGEPADAVCLPERGTEDLTAWLWESRREPCTDAFPGLLALGRASLRDVPCLTPSPFRSKSTFSSFHEPGTVLGDTGGNKHTRIPVLGSLSSSESNAAEGPSSGCRESPGELSNHGHGPHSQEVRLD